MNHFINAYKYKKDLNSRSSRRELNYFLLGCSVLSGIVIHAIANADGDVKGAAFAVFLFFFFSIKPFFALLVRRLHDLGRSGKILLLCILFPPLLFLFLIFLMIKKGQDGANKFGHAPFYK